MDAKSQPINFSLAPVMMRLLCGVFLIETSYVLALVTYLALRPPITITTAVLVLWVLQTIKFLVLAWLLLKIITSWAGQGAFLSGAMLILHRGVISAEEKVLELSQLRSVTVRQGWVGRRLNFGTLNLSFGRLGSSLDIQLVGVHQPDKYKDVLVHCIQPGQAQAE